MTISSVTMHCCSFATGRSRATAALAASLLLLAMGGCKKTRSEARAVDLASPSYGAVAGVARYTLSAAESTIKFVGRNVTGKHEGTFGTFSGTIIVADGSPEKASVTIDIDMTSLRADDPKLAETLKSAAFLDVTKYPKAHFTSTSARQGGDLGATDTITGSLDLHGVTRTIDIPATIHVRSNGVDVDAEVAIDRKQFGIVNPGPSDDSIRDDVVIVLLIYANRV
jgi:polyisoprenoid-binding protein YceI